MNNEFYDLMSSELRKKSNKHYLFEEIEGDYKDKMIKIFQKAIKDELSACSYYVHIAQKLEGFEGAELQEDFLKHAKEEYEHFNELLQYAADHGIIDNLEIGLFNYEKEHPVEIKDINAVIDWKQNLEKGAMEDYLRAAEVAYERGDIMTRRFFEHMAEDERRHLDDLQKYKKLKRG